MARGSCQTCGATPQGRHPSEYHARNSDARLLLVAQHTSTRGGGNGGGERLGGAIGDSSWIEAGEVPIMNFHGEADSLTPINCKTVIVAATGQPVVEVCGSREIAKIATREGNQKFYDDGFTDAYRQKHPWAG